MKLVLAVQWYNTAQLNLGDSAQFTVGNTAQLGLSDTAQLTLGNTAQLSLGDTAQLTRGNTAQLSLGDTTQRSITPVYVNVCCVGNMRQWFEHWRKSNQQVHWNCFLKIYLFTRIFRTDMFRLALSHLQGACYMVQWKNNVYVFQDSYLHKFSWVSIYRALKL